MLLSLDSDLAGKTLKKVYKSYRGTKDLLNIANKAVTIRDVNSCKRFGNASSSRA